jgi:hypothetical protein
MAEAFARALRDVDSIRDVGSWTGRVAFRLASKELKSRGTDVSGIEESTYEMPDPIPEVMHALRQLTPNQRMAVVLYDYADRSTEEVAESIGQGTSTDRLNADLNLHLPRFWSSSASPTPTPRRSCFRLSLPRPGGCRYASAGRVAERTKATVLKTVRGVSPSRVRIPVLPPNSWS